MPENEGFDVFFGYYNQVHAHDYYTDYLVRNSVNVPCQQSGKHTWEDYSQTRITNETLKFIEVTAKNSIGLVRTDSTTNELTVAGSSGEVKPTK